MASVIRNLSVDCADPYRLASFWSDVLGLPLHPDDEPGEDEAAVPLEDGRLLLFLRVPEPKTVKNRLHLCLDGLPTRDEEVERLLGRGATLVDDRRQEDGSGWAVLGDPEGNELCVLRGAAERGTPQA